MKRVKGQKAKSKDLFVCKEGHLHSRDWACGVVIGLYPNAEKYDSFYKSFFPSVNLYHQKLSECNCYSETFNRYKK